MFEKFRDRFPLEDDKWDAYINCFTRMEVPAKTILLKEGEIPQKLYLIERGCVRAWFNNNGKDVTLQFFIENNTVSSIESFIKQSPSQVDIEAIEPSVLWWIHKADVDRIIDEIQEIPVLRKMFTGAILNRSFSYMKLFFSFIKDTPTQRYLGLLEEYPWITKRIPQHYIASYLGVTTVHLSRIKSKLLKAKQ